MKKFKLRLIFIVLLFMICNISCSKCNKQEYVHVYFDTQGGTNIGSIQIEKNSCLSEPEDPLKEGYTFVQWELNGEVFDFTKPIQENCKLVAIWEKNQNNKENCTITFETDGGTNIEKQIVNVGTSISQPQIPSKEGYIFKHWELDGQKFDFNLKIYDDIILIAVWEVIPEDGYTVTFMVDGEILGFDTYTEVDKTISEPEIPEKEGYIGSWEQYTLTTGNIIIEAIYVAIEYTVTFKADGNIVGYSTYTVENSEIILPEIPSKEGYTASWEQYTLTMGEITIEAIYVAIEYTVTFIADGEIVGTKYYTVENNSITEFDVPSKDGYTGTWEQYVLSVGDVTVKAIYVAIEYTVTFEIDGEVIETSSYTIEDKSIVEPTIPEKEGYIGSWSQYTLILGNIRVYVEYKPIEYNVTFMAKNNVVGITTYTVENKNIIEPEVPYVEGYIGSWEPYLLTIGDIVINAIYELSEYKVTFMADDEIVDIVTYTIENKSIIEPSVPSKKGYKGKWESYVLTTGDVVVNVIWEEYPYSDLVYALNEDGVSYSVVGRNGCNDIDIVIAETYNELPVTRIGPNVFYDSSIRSVLIPDTVIAIDSYAFSRCSDLTTIKIPSGITDISEHTFSYCVSLKSIEIPNKVTNIGNYAFYSCRNLESIIFQEDSKLTNISQSAFESCSSLKYFKTPINVINIDNQAFSNCTNLKSIEISDNVANIGYSAFSYCENLLEVKIPNSVMTMGDSAFAYCSSLKELTISENITELESCTFSYCCNLVKVIIPNSVTKIGGNVFSNCTNLKSIELSDNLNSIGGEVFLNCINLEYNIYDNAKYLGNKNNLYLVLADTVNEEISSCVIKETTKFIMSKAFDNCVNLSDIYYLGTLEDWCNLGIGTPSDNPMWYASNFYMLDENEEFYAVDNIKIPDSVTKIFYHFVGFDNLVNIEIPDTVVSIIKGAFSGCSSLESITLPSVGDQNYMYYEFNDQLSYFGYIFGANSYSYNDKYVPSSLKEVIIRGGNVISGNAFYGCSNIKSIKILDGINTINSYAFGQCTELTNLEISNNVTTIGKYILSGSNKIEKIIIPFLGTSSNDSSNSYLGYLFGTDNPSYNHKYVPSTLTDVIITNAETLGLLAFNNCENLINVQLPNSLSYIEMQSFYNCSSLVNIEIPDNVTKIGNNVFTNCTNLANVKLSNSLTYIGKEAFSNCTNIENIELPSSLTYLATDAFSNCTKLAYNTYDNAKYLGCKDNFYFVLFDTISDDIISCNLHENVKIISESAFKDCVNLTSIEIPETVTSVGKSAFLGCTSLNNMTIPFIDDLYLGYFFGASTYSDNRKTVPVSLITVKILGGSKIGDNAFYGCENFKTIEIAKSVKSMGKSAFYSCDSLKTVYYKGTVEDWCQISFDGYNNVSTPMANATNIYMLNDNSEYYKVTEVIIPETITKIKHLSFYGFDNLTKVVLHDNVILIGGSAFGKCASLKTIIIPKSVETIEGMAFAYCTNLKIYCEASSKPENWNYNWNYSERPVVWGYSKN